jgi:hypothetical protein
MIFLSIRTSWDPNVMDFRYRFHPNYRNPRKNAPRRLRKYGRAENVLFLGIHTGGRFFQLSDSARLDKAGAGRNRVKTLSSGGRTVGR